MQRASLLGARRRHRSTKRNPALAASVCRKTTKKPAHRDFRLASPPLAAVWLRSSFALASRVHQQIILSQSRQTAPYSAIIALLFALLCGLLWSQLLGIPLAIRGFLFSRVFCVAHSFFLCAVSHCLVLLPSFFFFPTQPTPGQRAASAQPLIALALFCRANYTRPSLVTLVPRAGRRSRPRRTRPSFEAQKFHLSPCLLFAG